MHVMMLLGGGGNHGGGSDGSGGFDWPTMVVAIVAAVAAIAAALIALWGVHATNAAGSAQAKRDYVLRQLNELYGPLFMRRRLSVRLWRQLPGGVDPQPGTTWHLIDHIAEIKAEPDSRRREVVTEILKVNVELADLITGRAGLLDSYPAPDSFDLFLEHEATLRLLWDRGVNASSTEDRPFPRDFDDDVHAAIIRLRAALDD